MWIVLEEKGSLSPLLAEACLSFEFVEHTNTCMQSCPKYKDQETSYSSKFTRKGKIAHRVKEMTRKGKIAHRVKE